MWFDAGPDRPGRLLLVAHHLLVDGLSWRILLEDLARAWRGEPLPPVGTSLREWATTLSTVDRSAELELWSAQLDTPDPDLGARSFQPAVDTIGTADTRTLTLPESLSEAVLRTIPTAFHTGVQEVLLAGLALAVHRWRTRRGGPADRLLVDVEGHGREDLVPGADISRTVGWFTSLFPLGLDLAEEKDAAPDSGAVLRLVKETLRGLPDHGAGYGILRYLNEQGAELANRRPPQIGFNYLGQLGGDDTADFALAEPLAAPAGDPATRLAHALEINAYSTGSEQVMATVTAAGQLLSEDDLTELLEDWLAGLTELAEHTAAGGGGYTPSDFPLVTLNQQAIDALRAEYRGDFGSQIDVLPLTALQRGLRFHALLDETGADVYTVQFTFDLSGPVDTARLRAAGRELVRRHPNLAAAFPADAEVQVLPAGPTVPDIPFTELDLSPVDDEDDESAALDRALAADRAARFDLARPPLLRMTLINLGGRRSVLAVTNHHILLDGWSMPVLAQELFALYAGRRDLPAATPFAEHLRWLAGRDRAEAEHVWTTELSGVDEPTLLIPAGKGRRAVAPARVVEELPAAELVALTDMARHAGLTLNTVVQGAWGVLLGKLTGRADVTFGATVSGRPAELPGVETMVGLFINTVPVRVRVDEDQTDPAWVVLARLQDAQTGLLAHQHLGLADIQRAAGLDELFDTLTVFENYPLDPDALRLDGTGLAVTNVGGTDATHYPVTLIITAGETLKLRLDYQPEVISASDAELILRRLRRVLAAFVADPAVPVGAIDVLSPAERDQVLHGFNDTAHPVTATTLPAIFAEQAARTPDHAAVVFEDSALSYAELDAAANRLARLLIDRGVGPGRLVALAVPRSLELLVAMYAVHKAGAAYLPIDPDYPADRIEFMLGDADPAVLITTPAVNIEPGDTPTLVLPLPAGDLAGYSAAPVTDADRLTPLTPDHPAYVIYTSGSTGRPKGVLVPHRGIVNRLRWMQHAYPLDDTDRVVQKTPSGFDVSVWEFFWPLQIGATLVVARPEGHKDPLYLAELIDRERITTIHFVPSMLHAFMEALPAGAARGLRRVICSGEALPVELTEKLLATLGPTGTELHNLYGPTEASVDVTAWTCRPGETSVPIGRPVWNTQTYVLDGALNPAPIGVAGELYLAGDQLALGYLGRPALTAQRFVANPYGRAGARMYRTGDIARWRADGALEYLGRADDQVKIRGQRIELGEIETVLAGHPDVTQIAVVAREDTPGTKRLVAYVVGEVEPDALRAFAADTLPEPMVPAAIVAMPALPLTPNGKLDRKALPKPDFGSRTGGRAPATPAERVLAGLFADVLGVAEVSAEDSFFDLGGDSIISIQLVSRARQAGLGLTPRQVFEKRTVADLAAVATDLGGGLAAVTTEAPDAGTGELVPTPIAHWLLDEGGDITTFNQSMLLATPAGLTADWLDTALRTLIDHHDTLRLSVCGETGPGSWTVTVAPRGTEPAPGLLSRVDISTVDAEALTKTLAQEADAARAELDPWAGAVLRAVWFDAGPDRPGRLLLVAHHLVVDGVSWRVLTDDLARLWQGADPQPVGTSYRTWGTLLVEQASQRAGEAELWAEQLGHNGRPLGARPLDPAVDTAGTARTLTIEVPAEHTEALLSDLPTAYHANPQDVLLTALGLAVADWRGEPDAPVVVDVEGHGRADLPGTDTSRTLGWFTTSYPVRLDPVADDTDPANVWDGGPATGAAIKRVKEALRALPDNGLGFGLLRYLNPDTAPALAARPRPEIGFNYLGRLAAPGQPADWAPAPEGPGIGGGASPGMRLPHTIEINAVTQDGPDGPRLSATLLYPTGVLTEQRMRALADRWLAALAALADHARRPDAGGFTPSDLNLVELDQEDIESFEDELTSEWELS
ncbi:MAG TPA: amino acid adenylation domain-containing protein [Pseudonocardiaceae bacterium]